MSVYATSSSLASLNGQCWKKMKSLALARVDFLMLWKEKRSRAVNGKEVSLEVAAAVEALVAAQVFPETAHRLKLVPTMCHVVHPAAPFTIEVV